MSETWKERWAHRLDGQMVFLGGSTADLAAHPFKLWLLTDGVASWVMLAMDEREARDSLYDHFDGMDWTVADFRVDYLGEFDSPGERGDWDDIVSCSPLDQSVDDWVSRPLRCDECGVEHSLAEMIRLHGHLGPIVASTEDQ